MVEDALDDLEIFCADKEELFDVLDADGSGAIDISELISCLLYTSDAADD